MTASFTKVNSNLNEVNSLNNPSAYSVNSGSGNRPTEFADMFATRLAPGSGIPAPTVEDQEDSAASLSLWNKFISFFSADAASAVQSKEISITAAEATALSANMSLVLTASPIDRIPILDEPVTPLSDEAKEVLLGTRPFSLASDEDKKAIAMTMEQLISCILLSRLVGFKENATIEKASYEKFQVLRKVIREKLEKSLAEVDKKQKWGGFFGILIAAAAIVSIVLTAGAAAAFIAPAVVPALFAGFATGAGVISGITGAIGTAGKTYFDVTGNEMKAVYTREKEQKELLYNSASDTAQRMSDSTEQILKMQEQWITMQNTTNATMESILR